MPVGARRVQLPVPPAGGPHARGGSAGGGRQPRGAGAESRAPRLPPVPCAPRQQWFVPTPPAGSGTGRLSGGGPEGAHAARGKMAAGGRGGPGPGTGTGTAGLWPGLRDSARRYCGLAWEGLRWVSDRVTRGSAQPPRGPGSCAALLPRGSGRGEAEMKA